MRVRLLLLLGVCSDGSSYDVDVVARLPGGNDDARARAYRTIHATGLRTHPLHCPLDASLFTKMVADDDAVVACFADALEATIADENKNASGWSWASFAAGAGGELLVPTDFGGIRTGGVACFHQVRDAWAAAGYSATMVLPDAYYRTARTPGRQASGPLVGFRGARDVLLVPEGWHWTGIGALRERAAARFYSLTLAAADDRGRPVAKHKAFDGTQGVAAGWAVSRDLHKRYGLLGAPELYAAPCPVEDRYYRAAAAAKAAVGAGALADVVEALTNRNATADQVVAAALARVNQTRTGALVLVDTDGYRAGGQVRAALTETVARLRRRGYAVLKLKGFAPRDLPTLYAAAAAVVDFHVPGPERVVMEAALFNCWPVLVDEGYGGSALDFPIPERFRLRRADASAAEAAVVELVEGRGNATLEAEFAPWRRHVEALPERFDAAVEAFAFASHLQVHVEACGAAARPFAAIASALRAFPLASIEVHAGDAPRFLRTNYEGVEALAALGTDAGLEAAAAACAGCPPNVSRLRETALLPRALRLIRTSDAALRVVVDATHLHPPSTKLVGADGGLSALTAVSTEGAFDARLLALTALANCLEVDLENCRRFECAPLAARLASLLKTIGFEDDSDDWRVEDVLEAAHCAVPLACVARREAGRAKALAALTGAAVAPTALAKLLEALAVVQARSGALDRDAAAALAVLVRDLRKLFPGAPPTPEPKRARQQASPVGVESPTSDVVLPPPPPRTP
uniref:Uncharacterized protein n=1 Tax=Pelagomonas calceolata TaxID=35677 RepID=A0A7S4E680_9STRA